MAKLTKSELKGVFKEAIKECLTEILAENSQLQNIVAAKKQNTKKETITESIVSPEKSKKIAQDIVSRAMSDANNFETEAGASIENQALIETVNSVAESMTMHDKDKSELMKNILADTAATTLQEQPRGYMGGAAGVPFISKEQEEIDVASLKTLSPGGDAKNWAKIAFANKQEK